MEWCKQEAKRKLNSEGNVRPDCKDFDFNSETDSLLRDLSRGMTQLTQVLTELVQLLVKEKWRMSGSRMSGSRDPFGGYYNNPSKRG